MRDKESDILSPGEPPAAAQPADDVVCEHGTAMDVHCCNCHSGFIFDRDHECPEPAPPAEWFKVIHAIAVEAMTAQSDPHAEAITYRKALIGICNMALKAQDALKSVAK